MIEFVNGIIDDVNPEFIVVDVSGIGYQIFCPNPFIYQMDNHEKVKVYTYQHVREDTLALYGFKSRNEKALFTKLLSVSGIGPKGALAILATGEVGQVVQAIEAENDTYLTKFPGVGKKTARQIILDLKGKLQELITDPDHAGNQNQLDLPLQEKVTSQDLDEAVEALKVLGYSEREIKKVVPALSEEKLSTDQYIKRALQLLLNGNKR